MVGSLDQPLDVGSGHAQAAATSAHQVEGGNLHNDWARFEAGAATDHWNRVPEDVRLLRDIRANAYRFSIEWSRVEPVEGQWDEGVPAGVGSVRASHHYY